LLEAEPEEKGLGSKGEARPAYCVLAFSNHSCVPTITTVFSSEKEGRKYGDGLEATVTPNGLTTKTYFQYTRVGVGEDESAYDHTTTPQTIGFGLAPVSVSGGSECDLYYRAVAENAAGTSYGQEVWCMFG
jgi:hypothetical protein